MPADEVHQSSPSTGRKTFAFLPIDGHGHVNAMIGLADQLRSLGHRTVFVCNDSQSAQHFGHELILVRQRTDNTSADRQQQQQQQDETGGGGRRATEEETRTEEKIFIGDERLNSKWAQMVDLLDLNVNKPECVVESLTHNYRLLKLTIEQEIIPLDERIEQILIDLRPDLAVVDQLTPIPAIHRLSASAASGVGVGAVAIGDGGSIDSSASKQQRQRQPLRWISLCSCNPMPLYHDHSLANQFPPPLMGLSARRVGSGGQLEVQQLHYERILRSSGMLEALARLASMARIPVESEQDFRRFCRNESPWFNLYMFPAELDYSGERGLANLPSDRYHRVDCLIRAPRARSTREEEILLAKVEKWKRREFSAAAAAADSSNRCAEGQDRSQNSDEVSVVVYLSMGTTMSFNLALMEALLEQVFACLEQRPAAGESLRWRFVVALGARANLLSSVCRLKLERWQRADRVLAAAWWPQPELMRRKLVDLAVVHGGNNTICELFHFGVRALVVVPAFHDQLDNARRVADLGLGVSLPATNFLQPTDDLLLLHRSLRQALELADARTAAAAAAAWPSPCEPRRRDAGYCARLLQSKLTALA